MKRNSLISFLIFSIFLMSYLPSQGQIKVQCDEFPELTKKISDNVPDGKALFVFEGLDGFSFESDNENLPALVKNGSLYKVFLNVDPPSGGITIKYLGAESYIINYGRMQLEKTLPPISNKEIKYFKLSIVKQLIWAEQTNARKKVLADIASSGNDALVIIYPSPQNLDLQFEGETSSIDRESDRYSIYMKTGNQKLKVKSKNFKETIIELDSLKKEVRYFLIQAPQNIDDIIVEDSDIKLGNYVIESTPPGALIQMIGNPSFNEKRYKTPFTFEGYKAGAEIITLSLDRYEPEQDTIIISTSRGRKSKYPLTPKFAFINCNILPPIPESTILLDGNVLTGIENGKDFEIPKGTHKIEISAPHYYPETKQISMAAGQSSELNLKLKPKMGSLSIPSGENASETEVFIDNKSIGEIPITNLALQEGSYEVSFKKSGYISEKPFYMIEVLENKITKLNELRMVNTKKVRITTTPVNGATVYVDSKLLSDKTSLNVTLALGTHKVKIEREHYKTIEKTISVDQGHTEFNFELEELSYPVTFISKPSYCSVSVDGQRKGQTYFVQDISLGYHWLSFEKDGFLKKTKKISVTKPLIVAPKLFPSSYVILGADYGLDQYRINLGYVAEGILFSAGLQINANSNSIDESELAISNVIVDDIGTYNTEAGRIYGDSSKFSYNLKIGFTIKKPIVFLVTAGCSFIQTDKFQKVFRAQHDYLAQNNGDVIYEGELFSEPYLTKNAYTAFTAGLMIPIARTIYLSGEYYTNSDIGPGFSFGLGFMLGTHLKGK